MINKNTPLTDEEIQKNFQYWLYQAEHSDIFDMDIVKELNDMRDDREKIKKAFCRKLTFGTGGLRGIIGAGTGCMNVHTVAEASQGVTEYIKKRVSKGEGRIAVSYDSRRKSQLFAQTACRVFAANGLQVYIFPRMMPTPCLSFAVRSLQCDAGIMITASHNPSRYNGYKVYGRDGCQITLETAKEIYKEIEKIDAFADVRAEDYERGCRKGMINYIPEQVYTDFIEAVKKQSVLGNAEADKKIPIVYTPLNGTGCRPVLRVLGESGYCNITIVKEQQERDEDFSTCPYPNPEIRESMVLGIEYARREDAALVLATDPDCDRAGVAVKDEKGNYILLSGNETGILLLDYICSRRIANGTMPEYPVAIKTIVTTEMGQRIAAHYGVETINVLTGFKFIGEQVGWLEMKGQAEDFIFGYEESCGYLSGTYVRDKDGVGAALMICEMAAFYAHQGISLWERLDELYQMFGYCLNTLHTYGFEEPERMERLIDDICKRAHSFGGMEIQKMVDYRSGFEGMPKSNVVKFLLERDGSVIIRPSGTEAKLKVYVSVCGKDREEARIEEQQVVTDLEQFFVFLRLWEPDMP